MRLLVTGGAGFIGSHFEHKPEVMVNFATESHNSWAVINLGRFFKTNVLGRRMNYENSSN